MNNVVINFEVNDDALESVLDKYTRLGILPEANSLFCQLLLLLRLLPGHFGFFRSRAHAQCICAHFVDLRDLVNV